MRVDQSKAGSHSHPSALRPNSLSFGRQGEAGGFKGMETSNKNRMDRFGFLSNQHRFYTCLYLPGCPCKHPFVGGLTRLDRLSPTEPLKLGAPPKKEQTKNSVTEYYLVTETERIFGFEILQHWQFVVSIEPKSPTPPTAIVSSCAHNSSIMYI